MANDKPRNVATVADLLAMGDDAITVTEYCRRNDVDDDRARNMCRAGTFVGAMWVPVVKRWMIRNDAPVPAMPDTSRTKRADGRRPYTGYFTDAEFTSFTQWVNAHIDGDNIIRNPRDRKHKSDGK